jgi:hypothetical protein
MIQSRFHKILIAALCVLLLAACSRSDSDDDEKSGDDAGTSVERDDTGRDAQADERAGTGDSVPLRLTDEGRDRAAVAIATPADPRDTAFESNRLLAVPLYPRDTLIGPVSMATLSARDRAVVGAARDLFEALIAGELPIGSISPGIGPGGRATLEELRQAAAGLDEVRVGAVSELPGGEVSVPFRLLGQGADAVGEAVMAKTGDQWYTLDIRVGFLDDDTSSPFDPHSAGPGADF